MWIESVKPLRVQFKQTEIRLRPGHPVELSDQEGQKILEKAGDRVRVSHPPFVMGDQITWHRADGTTPQGTIDEVSVDTTGATWLFVTSGETWAAVNAKFANLKIPRQ